MGKLGNPMSIEQLVEGHEPLLPAKPAAPSSAAKPPRCPGFYPQPVNTISPASVGRRRRTQKTFDRQERPARRPALIALPSAGLHTNGYFAWPAN